MSSLVRSLIRPVARPWLSPARLAFALLTACLVLASATAMRTSLAARDHALQTMLNQPGTSSNTVVVSTDYPSFAQAQTGQDAADAGGPTPAGNALIASALDEQTQRAFDEVAGPAVKLPLSPQASDWTSLGSPTFAIVPDSAQFVPVRPGGPEMQFTYLADYPQHARLVAGRWPQSITQLSAGGFGVEIALPAATLHSLGLHVGSVFLAKPAPGGQFQQQITITVTGAYQPLDPGSLYWQDQPSDVAPQTDRMGDGPDFQLADGLLGEGELSALADLVPFGSQSVTVFTHLPLQTSAWTSDQVGGLITMVDGALGEAASNAQLAATTSFTSPTGGTGFHAPLVAILARFDAEQQAGALETAMPAVSLALIGLIALLLAARAAVDREAAENAVRRARGAPLWRIASSTARDTACTVLPLSAAAVLIAVLIPGRSPAGLWNCELALPLAAVAAPTLLSILRQRGRRGTVALTRPSPRALLARRIVAQAGLILLCLLGVLEAHAEGFSTDTGTNLFTACAPALGALLATLVVLNAGPFVLRTGLRRVARRRGAVGLLGLARTARTPSTAAVTVLVLALALTTAEMALALHGAGGREGLVAAASSAVQQAAAYSGTSDFFGSTGFSAGTNIVSSTIPDPDALVSATSGYLALLAIVAVATGCLVVALATAVEAGERRAVLARLTTMGLTAGQARAVTAVELLGPILFAAVGGTLAAPSLLWAVRPALEPALGGADARITGSVLAVPSIAVFILALAAGLIAAAAARRGLAGTLRLGDTAEGA